MKNLMLMEQAAVQVAAIADLNVAALTLPRLKMDKAHRATILLAFDASVGATVDFTVKQHNAATGGTTKDLAVKLPLFKKIGAATTFTKVELAEAGQANFVMTGDLGGAKGVVAIEILPSHLDVQNDFSHISVEFVDAVAAKFVCAQYILTEVKNGPAYQIAL